MHSSLEALCRDLQRNDIGRKDRGDCFWGRLRPQLATFGISRVGDLTGLDTLDLPIAQACRPCARSNAVTLGKGADLVSAAIGAVSEAIEMAAGEQLDATASWVGGATDAWRALYAPLGDGKTWPRDEDDWRTGWDLLGGKPAPVPAALLSTDFTRSAAFADRPVRRTTVGLGAGSNLATACLHGMLELVEHDATNRGYLTHGLFERNKIDIGRGGEVLAAIIRSIERAGARAAAWLLPGTVDLPCVWARIMEPVAASSKLALPAEGFGCRFTLEEAIVEALLEAAQARLAIISGAREDLTWRFYRQDSDPHLLAHAWWQIADCPAKASPWDRWSPPSAPLPALLDRLRSAGIRHMIATPLLDRDSLPIKVCRMVAPELATDIDQLREP